MCCGGGLTRTDLVRRAERAAMCLGCVHGKPNCQGITVEGRVMAGDCPRGKHPDGDGLTLWLWVRWRGVPMPLRWWAWRKSRKVFGDEAMRPGDYPGCGCIHVLKAAIERSTRSTADANDTAPSTVSTIASGSATSVANR